MKRHIRKKAAALLSLLCAIVFLLPLLSACGGGAEAAENPLDAGAYDADGKFIQLAWYPDAKMNNLNDKDFVKENGYFVYKGAGRRSMICIDVSSNQDVIDWEKVKAAGVEAAIMRAGYRTYGSGIIKTDETFYWNMKHAKEAGIKTGVYFFTQAVDEAEAEEEAQFVLDMLTPFQPDLPIYYDSEEINYDNARTDSLSGEQLTANAIAFCEYIKKAGYEPGVYANQMWLCNKMDLMQLEKYKIWLAKYADELNYPYEIEAWQYSSEGNVDGISTVVDMNVYLEK